MTSPTPAAKPDGRLSVELLPNGFVQLNLEWGVGDKTVRIPPVAISPNTAFHLGNDLVTAALKSGIKPVYPVAVGGGTSLPARRPAPQPPPVATGPQSSVDGSASVPTPSPAPAAPSTDLMGDSFT